VGSRLTCYRTPATTAARRATAGQSVSVKPNGGVRKGAVAVAAAHRAHAVAVHCRGNGTPPFPHRFSFLFLGFGADPSSNEGRMPMPSALAEFEEITSRQ
jgi:hypothetical protein